MLKMIDRMIIKILNKRLDREIVEKRIKLENVMNELKANLQKCEENDKIINMKNILKELEQLFEIEIY